MLGGYVLPGHSQCGSLWAVLPRMYPELQRRPRYFKESFHKRFSILISIILFHPREQIYNWQILWRNIFWFWLQFLPGLEAGDLEQFLYHCPHRHQGLQDFHQWEGSLFSRKPRRLLNLFFQEVLGLTDYEGSHRKRKGNIFLLNAFFKDSGFSYPMKAGLSITATFIF